MFDNPSAANRIALARTTSRCGLEYAAARRSSSRRCSSLKTTRCGDVCAIAHRIRRRSYDSFKHATYFGRRPLSEGDKADSWFREAISRLTHTRVRAELARTHLLYGEWLRREKRRADARAQLRVAHGQFSSIGMAAFAERARRELSATGETVRARTVERRDDLTQQERQIARLASDGLSNPEIGARLFLSPRTVEYHLRKVSESSASIRGINWQTCCRPPSPSPDSTPVESLDGD